MSVVELGIKVSIDGNKEAVDGMGQLADATAQVGVAAEDTSQKLLGAQQAATDGVEQMVGNQLRYGEALGDTGAAAQGMGQKIAAAQREASNATAQLVAGQRQVSDATAKAGVTAQDVGQKIVSAQKEAGDATTRLTLGQQLFIEKLQQQAAAAGMTKTQLLEMQAAQMGLSGVSAQYIAQIDAATAGHHQFNLASAGTTRELVVIGREIMTGNFDRLGGSLVVLANRTGLAQLAFSATGAAIAGTLAIAASIAYVFYEGTQQSEKFANSLKITGDYAGLTEGQFNAMARSIADSSSGTISEARTALQTLVSTGQFTGEALTAVGAAALTMSRLTGQSSEEVAKDFAKMADGVVKWVDEHDKQYHAISTAQYQHIRTLEEEGKTQEAMAQTGKLVDDALQKNTENLGYIRSSLKTAKTAWDEFWDSALDAGRTETPEKKIAGVIAEIERVNSGRTSMSRDEIKAWGKQKLAELAGYEKEKADAEAKARQDAADKKEAEDGKQAVREIAAMHQRYETSKQAEIREIKQYKDDIEKVMKGGGEVDSDALQAQTIAAIHARYANKQKADDPRAAELANALRADQDEINAEKAKYTALEQMADLYHKYGATSDADFYAQKKGYTLAIEEAEIAGYDKQLAALQAFHGKTERERTTNAGKIAETQAKRLAAESNYSTTVQKYYVEEMLQSGVAQKHADEAMDKHLLKLTEEANKAEAANLVHGKSKSVLDLETIATNNNAIAKQRARIAQLGLVDGQEAEIVHAQKVIASLEAQNVQLGRTAAAMNVAAQIKIDDQQWANAVDAAKNFEAEASTSFGNVGTAIGKMTVALTDYGAAQDKIDKQRALAMSATTDEARKQQIADKAKLDSAQLQVKSYGDIAHAASGLFDQHSKGYAAMQAVEKAFRIAEMAMSAEATIAKVLGITTVTTAKAAANTAEVAGSVATAAPVIATEGAKQTAYGVTALAAALAAPFPANIPAFALVGAMLASIGVLIGGGGGGSAPDVAKVRQDAQGTGSVLGDSTAKSDSIAKSISIVAANSDASMPVSMGMLASLKSIENSVSGLGGLLVRDGLTGATAGNTSGAAANIASSTAVTAVLGGVIGLTINKLTGGLASRIVGKVAGSILGGATTVDDTGLLLKNGNLGAILANGVQASQYTDTTKKGGWFSSDKHNESQTTLGAEANSQFTQVIANMATSITQASTLLGTGGADFTAHLQGFVVDIGKVSLKGLTGDQIQKQLEAAFSKLGDDMARYAVSGLDKFQKVGEGYLQTLVRVSSGIDAAHSALEKFGITAINYTAILDKQGDVGAEIVRQSVESVETLKNGALTGVGQIVALLQGTAADLGQTYQSLLDLRKLMTSVNLQGGDLSAAMIAGAGGSDQLKSGLSSYLANYFTDAERAAAETRAVATQFAALGLAMPATKEEFRALVEQIGTGTDATAALTGKVLNLSDAFNQAATDSKTVADATIAAAKASADAAKTASADLIASLQKNVDTARSALTTAYNAEASALNNTITSMRQFANSITDFRESLLVGTMSPESPLEQYNTARAQYEATLARAEGGDTTAQGQVQSSATAFLNASKAYNASSEAYARDFNAVQLGLKHVASTAAAQVDIAQQQLTVLNNQMTGLITINSSINNSALTISQAIGNLNSSLSALAAAGGKDSGAPAALGATGGVTGQRGYSLVNDTNGNGATLYLPGGASHHVAGPNGSALLTSTYGLQQDASGQLVRTKFAKGGVFTNGVVSQPTDFNFGQMGEAGPEAIMPLVQTGAGLGVRALGTGGGDTTAAVDRQTAAIERQNQLLERQNQLLEQLATSTDEGQLANFNNMRDLKQYLGHVISKVAA